MELAAAFLYYHPDRIDVSHSIFNILEGVDSVDLEFGTLLWTHSVSVSTSTAGLILNQLRYFHQSITCVFSLRISVSADWKRRRVQVPRLLVQLPLFVLYVPDRCISSLWLKASYSRGKRKEARKEKRKRLFRSRSMRMTRSSWVRSRLK